MTELAVTICEHKVFARWLCQPQTRRKWCNLIWTLRHFPEQLRLARRLTLLSALNGVTICTRDKRSSLSPPARNRRGGSGAKSGAGRCGVVLAALFASGSSQGSRRKPWQEQAPLVVMHGWQRRQRH